LEKIIGGVTAIISFPPERMDAAVCRAEVCYPFGSELRETLAVKRRAFITLLVAATTHEDTGRKS
jgi:hypothetical protein